MKEVYKSFEGSLGIENQSGYIIGETEKFYQIDFLNIDMNVRKSSVQICKEFLPVEDFGNLEKITELVFDIENGRRNVGRCLYKNRWYGYDAICSIQEKHHDYNWKKYV